LEGGARKRKHAVDIEFACLELRIEPRPRAIRRVGDAALDGLAVELELQAIDGKLLRPDVEIARGTKESRLPWCRIRAALKPGQKRARIARLDLRRALEAHALRRCRHATAQPHLRKTGPAEFKRLDIPAVVIQLEVAAHVLQRAGGERHRVDTDAEPHRKRRSIGRGERFYE